MSGENTLVCTIELPVKLAHGMRVSITLRDDPETPSAASPARLESGAVVKPDDVYSSEYIVWRGTVKCRTVPSLSVGESS